MSNICCTESQFLGCFASCGDINTGLNAVQTGDHTVEYYFLGGICTRTVTGVIGNPFVIPADIFNEYGQATIKILQPDNTYFTSGAADCFILSIAPSNVC